MMRICASNIVHTRDGKRYRGLAQSVRDLAADGIFVADINIEQRNVLGEDWRPVFAELAEEAVRLGVRLRYAHLPFAYPVAGDAEGWARFGEGMRAAIEAARFLDVECAAVHSHSMFERVYDEEAMYRHAIEHLAPFVERSKQVGLPLAIEIMGQRGTNPLRRYCSSAEQLIRIADAFGEGVCWDTGHANLSSLDQHASLVRIGARLRMLHVNDNDGLEDEHLIPFSGTVDWAGVLAGLREIGFAGDLNLEIKPAAVPYPLRHEFVRYMVAAGNALIEQSKL